jgi:hypothetical protein
MKYFDLFNSPEILPCCVLVLVAQFSVMKHFA